MKKYVVITGASSGIGYATAKQFAKRKKNLILIARRVANLVKLKNDIEKEVPEVEVFFFVQFSKVTFSSSLPLAATLISYSIL